jgi:small nuclear ribonucleoprotein D3
MSSIPLKLLHEGEHRRVTVEMKNGETYYGELKESSEGMNLKMNDVLVKYADGRTEKMDHVFLRGSSVRFVVLPDLLKKAPMFAKVQSMKKQKEEEKKQKRGRGRNQQ